MLARLLDEAKGEGKLPPFKPTAFKNSFPTIESAFQASLEDLAAAFGLAAEQAEEYARRLRRLFLWKNPNEVIGEVKAALSAKMADMPRTLSDLEGVRDPIDPFIVAFTQRLIGSNDPSALVRALIIHKCMMKVEDAIGHLHQAVVGSAGGSQPVPEPQGESVDGKRVKETWHPTLNPYPGADAHVDDDEFYQIKSKTGSAKGSDGEKLGRQFLILKQKYPNSRRFYISMIGRTLAGHRSMGAFLRTDPDAEVLVGATAFQQLGKHRDTPEIVLELYLEAFEQVLTEANYKLDEVVASVTAEWVSRHGSEDPSRGILFDTVAPLESDPNGSKQSSATYSGQPTVRKAPARKSVARKAVAKAPIPRSKGKQ